MPATTTPAIQRFAVAVAALKGGTGKSTIATSLAGLCACAGIDTMLLDTDKTLTSTQFVAARNKQPGLPRIHSAQQQADVYETVLDLRKRYQAVIIDTPGHDCDETRTALLAVDTVIVPLRASGPDLSVMPNMQALVKLTRRYNPSLRAYVVISMAPNLHVIHEAAYAREYLADFDQFVVATTEIHDRKAYRDALLAGRSAAEMSNATARAEIQLLGQELFGIGLEAGSSVL